MNYFRKGVNATLPPICFTAVSALTATSLWGWTSAPFLALAGIGAVDTWFRWKEYVRLRQWFDRQDLINFGTFVTVLHRHRSSWCRRRLAVHASRAAHGGATYEPAARECYYDLGYRWWHMLPDGSPMVFLKRSWWRGLIGRVQ